MLKPAKRSYNCSDGDLQQAADLLAISVARDLTDFAAYNVNYDDVLDLKAAATTFSNKATDDESLGDQKTETDNKNALRKELEELLRLIRTAAQIRYGAQGKYRKFGFDGFNSISDNDFVRVIRRVQRVLTELQSEMELTFPSVAAKITALTTKGDAFDEAVDLIIDKKNSRDLATQERILAGNALYSFMYKLCIIGKALYQDTNAAKYNDYILGFQGSIPEESENPVNVKIEGIVTNSITNAPVMDVRVTATIGDRTFIATSGIDGKYSVDILVVGNCSLFFEHEAYDWYRQENIVLVKDRTITVGAVMIPYTRFVGFIMDAVTHNPIGGVSVIGTATTNINLNHISSSTGDGHYSLHISNTSYTYTLKFTKAGYSEVQVTNVAIALGETKGIYPEMTPITP